jgi:broad-specificity NMP kinase
MHSSARRFLAVPAALLIIAALPGCGKTTIDSKKLEKLLAANFTGGTVKSVSCPSGVEAKRGYTFTCSVTLDDGRQGKQGIRIANDKGHVDTTTFKFTK